MPSGAQVELTIVKLYCWDTTKYISNTIPKTFKSLTSTVLPVVGHVVSVSVLILKLPQQPFGEPPQIPPLPCGGICGGPDAIPPEAPVGWDEEEIGVEEPERAVDALAEDLIDEARAV
jgi:hypothetical protein